MGAEQKFSNPKASSSLARGEHRGKRLLFHSIGRKEGTQLKSSSIRPGRPTKPLRATSSPTSHRQHTGQNMSQTDVYANQEDFIQAVRDGDAIELQKMLQRWDGMVNINYFDKEGQTALHLSCLDGNLELVKLLVKFGADIRLANRDGWSALHIACYGGHNDIALYLIANQTRRILEASEKRPLFVGGLKGPFCEDGLTSGISDHLVPKRTMVNVIGPPPARIPAAMD
ncbi:hypothetical protein JTE90_014912 [Oedothorax gibbosus]|uniref:Notch-regulated ankyrin repeat-containing protein n=1 Tax=Oedothorax gibbosus TaxID=931172 RepID=A0AAV6VKU0_9ARAC|nr:hypothetical protein JTE90_014912 [Oedothorax gibbosus]